MKLPKIINRKIKQKHSIEECLKEVALEIKSENGRIKKSKESLSFLTEKLKISEIEVKILSCISFPRTFNISNHISECLNIFNLKDILKEDFKEDDLNSDKILNKSIQNLLELNYIFNGGYSRKDFRSSDYFLKVLEENEIKEEKIDNLDTLDLIILISNYIYELTAENYNKKRYMTSEFCYRKVSEFIDHNKTLTFSRELTNIILEIYKDARSNNSKKNQDILSFLYLVCEFVIKGRSSCYLDDFTKIYEEPSRVYSEFRYGSNVLLMRGYIEETGTNWRGLGIYSISSEVRDTLLKEIDLKEVKDTEFIYPESIVGKELFYDQNFYDKIKDLYSFLDEDRFKAITSQLKEKGFKTGFTCLFYGSPGTGKTETVYQISKATNRPIFQIDLSSIRDKYVGESEKKLKSIFIKYKKRLKSNKAKKIPIMFFNEADGIINNRLENQRDSVDKMENTLQNILLQELEDFEGILIATTNLQGSLDKAFDRRFLYKLNFKTPSPEIKAKIWMSKIENLPGEIAIKLSKEFDFSGGQIDNVARKYIIQKILQNKTEDDFGLLFEFCKEENIEKHGKIGFLPSL